jgi:hypothetical protein
MHAESNCCDGGNREQVGVSEDKSQTQRKATAKPNTDGRAASQRQWAAPAISTRNPSHSGRSQKHNQKNAVATASATIAMGQCCSPGIIGTFPEFGFVIIPAICTYELATLLSPQLDCRIR